MDTQRTRGTVRKKVMYDARSVLTFLFIVMSLAGATTSIAAEDTSPPSATSYEVSVLAHAWGRPKTCPDIFMTVIFPS